MIHFYPKDVVAHVTRLRMTGPHAKPLDDLVGEIGMAAAALADAKCSVVTFHCTVTSMSDGPLGERKILDALKTAGALLSATTSTAVHAAFEACNAQRIALVTPYNARKTEEEVAFIESIGYRVVSAKGYDLANSDAYCATPSAVWRARLLDAARPDADAYFLSCANIRCIGEVAGIETVLGKPVLTSNLAVIWDGLRLIGKSWDGDAPGSLFTM